MQRMRSFARRKFRRGKPSAFNTKQEMSCIFLNYRFFVILIPLAQLYFKKNILRIILQKSRFATEEKKNNISQRIHTPQSLAQNSLRLHKGFVRNVPSIFTSAIPVKTATHSQGKSSAVIAERITGERLCKNAYIGNAVHFYMTDVILAQRSKYRSEYLRLSRLNLAVWKPYQKFMCQKKTNCFLFFMQDSTLSVSGTSAAVIVGQMK